MAFCFTNLYMNISREWKQEVSIENYQVHISKVNLFDLLFYTENGKTYPRTNYTKNALKPLELDHKIIVFNSNNFIYDKYYKLKETEDEHELSEQHRSKFALALPKFDLRSKPLFINDTPSKSNIATYTSTSSVEFQKYLEQVKPKLLEIGDYFSKLQNSGSSFAPGIKVWDEDSIKEFETTEAFDFNSLSQSITFDIDENFVPTKVENKDINYI